MARSVHCFASVLACAGVAAVALAGPLDPPAGPVAPTGKTIGEVEPRTPVNSLPSDGTSNTFLITERGSYYLTDNIVGQAGMNGILIALAPGEAGAVSIDLNGFSMIGPPGSGDAIRIDFTNLEGLSVHNGVIQGWTNGASQDGVVDARDYALWRRITIVEPMTTGLLLPAVQNVRAVELRCRRAGGDGIVVGDDAIITDTVIEGSGGVGLKAGANVIIKGSKIKQNAAGAIEGGIDGVLHDNLIEGALTVGAYWNVRNNIFLLDLDQPTFAPLQFNDGLHHIEGNDFNIHGTNTAALPAVAIAGARNLFRSNTLVAVDPPPPAPQATLRSPAVYMKYDGVDGESKFVENTMMSLHPGTEGIEIAGGAGNVIAGNRISGTAQGGVVAIRNQSDFCFILRNVMTRLGPTGVGIMDLGVGSVIAPIVSGSALGGNSNPDRNVVIQ